MVQGYYTLQEAAQVLGMPPDELKRMAQKNEIRSFQDRGTWRFRVQDIQEMARRRGLGSEMDMIVPDVKTPRPSDSPAPRKGATGGPKSAPPKSSPPKSSPPKSPPRKASPPSPAPQVKAPDVFSFSLDSSDEAVDLNLGGDSGARKAGPKSGPKSAPKSGPATPVVPAGSDSDVRLVSDGSDMTFSMLDDSGPKLAAPDSNVKMVHEPGPSSSMMKRPGSGPTTPRKQAQAPVDPLDSGVRLVPMDSDSDVKIVGAGSDEAVIGDQPPKSAADSDIRLHPGTFPSPSASDEGMLTEEINLDEELRKQEASQAKKQQPKPKAKPQPKLPAGSPFELSEHDLDISPLEPAAQQDSSDFDLTPAKPQDDSSDFDLTPGPGSSPVAMDSDEISLAPLAGDEELKGPDSGISLENPADSGISLEQEEASEDIEFELSLDADGGATPRPTEDIDDSPSGSSEFELSLDVEESGEGTADSSEFELTLDDNAGLVDEEAPQVKAEDKDIFETDFEAAAAEDESASEVAALDTDLDSSEFDLDLADSEIEVEEEESGSQVVALDEEEGEAGAETVAAKRKKKGAAALEEEPAFDDLGEEAVADVEEEAGGREVVREKVLQAAPWGALPVVFMLPCVVVMILVGIMGFELVTSMTGYRPPGFLTKAIADVFQVKL